VSDLLLPVDRKATVTSPDSHHSEKAIPGRHIVAEAKWDIYRSKIHFGKDFFAHLDYDKVSKKSSEELVELSSAKADKNITDGIRKSPISYLAFFSEVISNSNYGMVWNSADFSANNPCRAALALRKSWNNA
jgi:hypothetical protein